MTPDELVAKVLEQLEPRLVQAADAAVRKAAQASEPILRPASVLTFDATTGDATVVVDGDEGEETDAQVITAYPLHETDRVMVLFVPPHGVYVIGHVNGFPVIAGFDSAGLVTTIAATPTYTTVKTITIGDVPLGRAYRLVAQTTATLYSLTAAKIEVEVLVEVSIDGGATWVGSDTNLTSTENDAFTSATVTASTAGSSNENRPMIRVRARRVTSETAATYDLRDVYTSWTITPQE